MVFSSAAFRFSLAVKSRCSEDFLSSRGIKRGDWRESKVYSSGVLLMVVGEQSSVDGKRERKRERERERESRHFHLAAANDSSRRGARWRGKFTPRP